MNAVSTTLSSITLSNDATDIRERTEPITSADRAQTMPIIEERTLRNANWTKARKKKS
ncbi:AAEL017278-PA [Aedes aegypti]|uniref:AAEL017278-PA n=1 Tax=Aedes aegypti TaxID=7159 RepID=J9HGB3_AEDAE|nr:AAEL017278-PA [Aedes aegypti]